jgi:hypothetical protein
VTIAIIHTNLPSALGSARSPMVRDASLRDAPHHEDRFV